MKRVAGIDIGFRHTGISIFDLSKEDTGECLMSYVDSVCYSTKKVKKSKDYVAQQDAEDIRSILSRAGEYLQKWDAKLLIIELPTGGAKSGRAARCMGAATTMCVALPMMTKSECIFTTPREVKIAATGDPYAEKDAIIKAMGKRVPQILKHKKGDQEHIADSIGCVLSKIKEICPL